MKKLKKFTCCPCFRFEPDTELYYLSFGQEEYTDILENLIIKRVPTGVLISDSRKLTTFKPLEYQGRHKSIWSAASLPILSLKEQAEVSMREQAEASKQEQEERQIKDHPLLTEEPRRITNTPEKPKHIQILPTAEVKPPSIHMQSLESIKSKPPSIDRQSREHNQDITQGHTREHNRDEYCICGTSLNPVIETNENNELFECHGYMEPMPGNYQTIMYSERLKSNLYPKEVKASSNLTKIEEIPLPSSCSCSCSCSSCCTCKSSEKSEESSTQKCCCPPPDIQQTLDILKVAKPKKTPPPAKPKNQRTFVPGMKKRLFTSGAKAKLLTDDSAPIVHYHRNTVKTKDFQLSPSSLDVRKAYSECSKLNIRDADSSSCSSATKAESDITMESSDPIAEISQLKGDNLKWKIIIKQHKGRKNVLNQEDLDKD